MNVSIVDFDCVGCGACAEVCSRKALTMIPNKEGFKYPVVDNSLCVDCGLCNKVCPSLNSDIVKHQPGQVYAAVNNNRNVLKDSSSGGLFSVIAEYVIDNGGGVCGAAFNKELTLSHIYISDVKELERLRGSKYLQSDIQSVFSKIKDYLRSGKQVYFVGTSCQVAALRLYLKKEYDNLITSDIICHGVPSQKIFNVFQNHFEKKNDVSVVRYNFRDKSVNGWSCSSSSSSIDNKTGEIKQFDYDRTLNAYFAAFISGSINRECCYRCKFTTESRVSDITLADFWNVEKFHKELNVANGVSLVIVNTEKGKRTFEQIQSKITYVESTYRNAEQVNKCLYAPTPRPAIRDHIYDGIDTVPSQIVDRFTKKGFDIDYLKFRIKRFLRHNEHVYELLFNLKRKFI